MITLKKILRSGFLLLIGGLIALAAAGCRIPALSLETTAASSQPGSETTSITADPTADQLTWSGTILSVDPSGRSFLAAVDLKDQKILGDKAWVSLYDDAEVVLADTGAPCKLQDAPVGSAVTVTITGGIRESYPVQTSAILVRVSLAGQTE